MFNFLKVAHYLQNVPNFTHIPDTLNSQTTYNSEFEDQQLSHIYFSRNFTDSPRKQTGSKQNVEAGAQQKGDQQKKNKQNKRNDDNSNNNGGGFLQPIIQDLQGFLKGRRNPVSPVLIQM